MLRHPLTGRIIKTKAEPYKQAQIEVLDLKVNAIDVPLTKDYDFIARVLPFIQWSSNTPLFTTFGGITALTNGINLEFDGILLLDGPITSNADFYQYMYDVTIKQDSTATKINILTGRFSFDKFVPNGLDMRDKKREFIVKISDNLTSGTNIAIKLIIQGYLSI